MALRCAWRSTNISETSRLELSIGDILRGDGDLRQLKTLNAAFCPYSHHQRKHRFEPCCNAHELSCEPSYFRPESFLAPELCRPWPLTRPAIGVWPTAWPMSAWPNAMAPCGALSPGKKRQADATTTTPMSQKEAGQPWVCPS